MQKSLEFFAHLPSVLDGETEAQREDRACQNSHNILTKFSQLLTQTFVSGLLTMRIVVVMITVVAVICYSLATSFLEGKGTGSKYFRLCRPDDLSDTCRQVSVGDWFQDLLHIPKSVMLMSFMNINGSSIVSPLYPQMQRVSCTLSLHRESYSEWMMGPCSNKVLFANTGTHSCSRLKADPSLPWLLKGSGCI